jgi:hypothetical protein
MVSHCRRDCRRISRSEVNKPWAVLVLVAILAIQAAAAINMGFLDENWRIFILV